MYKEVVHNVFIIDFKREFRNLDQVDLWLFLIKPKNSTML